RACHEVHELRGAGSAVHIAKVEIGARLAWVGMRGRPHGRHAMTAQLIGNAVFLFHGSEDAGELAVIGLVINGEPVLDLLDGELALLQRLPIAREALQETKTTLREVALLDRPRPPSLDQSLVNISGAAIGIAVGAGKACEQQRSTQ